MLHYEKSGNGPEHIVLFHGFGQDLHAFDAYLPFLSQKHTVYAFDLYYHGSSVRANRPLNKKEWLRDFGDFLKKERITSFSLIAFSLGGRFALNCVKGYAENIDKLVLIAPDGIYKNFWYLFATSIYGNWLFKYLMLRPDRFDKLLGVFERFRLASPSMIRFAQKELQNRKNCLRVYQSWTYFRPMQENLPEMVAVLNRHNISVNLFLGEKDYIIPMGKVVTKLAKIKQLTTTILPLKHHHLIDGAKSEISSLMNGEIL